ncbi:MAG: PspC domain-containing protein [Actinomycetota bacterium]|nr:PspC domain-containing protein [Actinomycetota bacterium]
MQARQDQGPTASPLRRSASDRMLAGVAGGVAAWLGADAQLVRIGFVAAALAGGLGVPLYLAAWLLLPEEHRQTSIAEDLLEASRLA